MSKMLKISTVLSICALAMVFSPKVEALSFGGLVDSAKSAISGVDPKAAKTEASAILKRNKKKLPEILVYRSKLKRYALEDQPKVTQFCDKFCNRLACGKTPTSDAKAVKGMQAVATACFVMCNPSLTKNCSAAAKEKFPKWMASLEKTRKAGLKLYIDLKKLKKDLKKLTNPEEIKKMKEKITELKKMIPKKVTKLKKKIESVGITLP